MYICLYRNKPQGSAITGRLVIDGRWFCNTLERVGYQIPALCYHVAVTMSPKFKRLLPLVTGVPRLPIGGTPSNSPSPIANRSGIRFHRGTKPEHSTGCILVVADNPIRARELIGAEVVESSCPSCCKNPPVVVGRSAAEVEQELTQLLLETQNNHEEIILEVIDYRPGTEYGYDHPCESVLQEHNRDAHRAEERYYHLHPEERAD